MTTANERFLDAQLQRAVELELLAGAVARDLNDLLDEDREWMELETRRAAEAAATSGLRGASAGRGRSILARMRRRRGGEWGGFGGRSVLGSAGGTGPEPWSNGSSGVRGPFRPRPTRWTRWRAPSSTGWGTWPGMRCGRRRRAALSP